MARFPLILAAVLLGGCATPRDAAITGTTADAVTTLVAVGRGATELNPLGVAGALLVKPLAVQWIDRQPASDRTAWWRRLTVVSVGATANNLCIIGGGAGCIFIGITAGAVAYIQSKE